MLGRALTPASLAGTATFRTVTLASIGLAGALYLSGYQDLIFDAWGYAELARHLSRDGLLAAANENRTYGYPLFIALCTGFQEFAPKTVRLLVFLGQLTIYLLACAAGAKMLGRIFRSAWFSRAAYAATALNPFLLARVTETLSDSVSAILVYLGVLLSLPHEGPSRARPSPSSVRRDAAVSFLLVALAAVIRPSHLAALLAVTILWLVRQVLRRDLSWSAAPLLAAAVILPFLPQLYVNSRVFGRAEPLMVRSLYRDQTRWGMAGLKYGTLLGPGKRPELVYDNPLYRSEPDPMAFLRSRPGAYLATLGLHLFAMFDYDFLLTYSTVSHPWYRWPLSFVNYAFLFLCLAGIVGFLRGRTGWRDPERFAGFALLGAAGSSVALYLPTLVESRFSAPALMLLTPFLVQAIAQAREWLARRQWKTLLVWAVAAILFVGSCAGLSAWIAAQAPRLAAEGESRGDAGA